MIKVEGLVKIYPPDCKAVDNLNLHVKKGEIIGFLGPNGAGKSTTIRVLTTLSPFTLGAVRVAGFDVKKEPEKVRRVIGYVAQETGIDYFLTGRENLMLQGRMYKMKKADILERIKMLSGQFDLDKVLDKLVSTYSGGIRRKLDIATALIHDPEILFLDEPTLGLDIKSRQSLWQHIKRMNKELSLTIVLTTHYLEEADKLAGQVIIINEGKVKVTGTPDELKNMISGDSLTINFDEVTGELKSFAASLEQKEFIKSITWDDDTLHLYVENGGEAVPRVMTEFVKQTFKIKTIALSRPTLDDVFLKYTGTSMLEVEEKTGDEWWMQWAGKGGGSSKWWNPEESEDGEGGWNAEEAAQWQAGQEGGGKWSSEEIKEWQQKQVLDSSAADKSDSENDSAEKMDSTVAESAVISEVVTGIVTEKDKSETASKATENESEDDSKKDEVENNSWSAEDANNWQPGKWSPEEIENWQKNKK